MRLRTRGWGRGAGRRHSLPAIGLAVLALWLCTHLLHAVWIVFQHAYVNSYWAVSGARINQVYWSSLRFAFGATVAVAALGAALAGLLALELSRLRR